MRPSIYIFAFSAAISISGCSTYPLTQDLSGVTSEQITSHIRCEMRDALRTVAINNLKEVPTKVYRNLTGAQLADLLTRDPDLFAQIDISKLKGRFGERFRYFSHSQVGYEFTLDLTENNVQDFGVGLTRKLARQVDGFGFDARGDRTREVKRTFDAIDKFEDLAKTRNAACLPVTGVDYVFPIRGHLPFYDLVNNYVRINQFATVVDAIPTLSGTEKGPAVPRMGDTIIFTTRVTGKFDPTLTLTPPGTGLNVTSLTILDDNYREEKHQVIVTLTTSDVVVHTASKTATGKSPPDPTSRINDAKDAIVAIRDRNVQDAIVDIGSAFSKLGP